MLDYCADAATVFLFFHGLDAIRGGSLANATNRGQRKAQFSIVQDVASVSSQGLGYFGCVLPHKHAYSGTMSKLHTLHNNVLGHRKKYMGSFLNGNPLYKPSLQHHSNR